MTTSIRSRVAVKFNCPKSQTNYCAETENFPWVFTCIMCGEMATTHLQRTRMTKPKPPKLLFMGATTPERTGQLVPSISQQLTDARIIQAQILEDLSTMGSDNVAPGDGEVRSQLYKSTLAKQEILLKAMTLLHLQTRGVGGCQARHDDRRQGTELDDRGGEAAACLGSLGRLRRRQ